MMGSDEYFAAVFTVFLAVAIIVWIICHFFSIKGMILFHLLKKNKIKSDRYDFTCYYTLDDAYHYSLRVVLVLIFLISAVFYFVIAGAEGAPGMLVLIVTIFYILCALWNVRKIRKSRVHDSKEYLDKKEYRRMRHLALTFGLPEVVKLGWGLLLCVCIVGFFILGSLSDESLSEKERWLDM